METIGVALLGAGRMGKIHAMHLATFPEVRVVVVADPSRKAAEEAGRLARAERVVSGAEEAIGLPGVEAVVIVSPTSTHAAYLTLAARLGKPVFCEKPVALSLDETRSALAEIQSRNTPFQIGFQRRFDPGYAEARKRIEAGEIGVVEQFHSVGRDPSPPPLDYLKVSGGLFLDQAVHELDLARFLVGEIEEINAWGAVLVEPTIARLNDVDTATTLLRFTQGALGVIENSRRAVYGYDIRTEIFGSKGKLVVEALAKTPIRRFGREGVSFDHYAFFTDRFLEAARLELLAFFQALREGRAPAPGSEDALAALRLALAATRSLHEGRAVRVEEV